MTAKMTGPVMTPSITQNPEPIERLPLSKPFGRLGFVISTDSSSRALFYFQLYRIDETG